MTPRQGNKFLFRSSSNSLVSALSQTLQGLFELTLRPSRALNLPCAQLLELQRYTDTVRCVELGAEVQGHRQEQLTQTLIALWF